MDIESLMSSQNKVVEKLNTTTKRIQKARKNTKTAEKEAAEFEEIHKLLESTDDSEPAIFDPESLPNEIDSPDCNIPITLPGIKVFDDKLILTLFSEKNCHLKSFIDAQEKCLIFGKNDLIPTEECFRKLIAYHVTENLMPEEGSCSSISLYVFYLMSVHQDLHFVSACSDFLKYHKFLLRPEDIFPVFVNFGAKQEELGFQFCKESFLKKFCKGNDDAKEIPENVKFPFFNVEMAGQILLQYITEDLLAIDSNIKSLIRGLVKITLDPKIRSGLLLPLYSTILTVLCSKIQNRFKSDEILSWVYLKDEHLLNQIEICRSVSRSICPELQESLVLKTLSDILKLEVSPVRPPIKISHIKSVLKKLRSRELSALELYSLLQLINGSLPGLTATVKDSTEINTLLVSLEQNISKIVDSVDLVRLKLEIAKVGNLVMTKNTNNRFTVHETMHKSSVKKVKCSN